MVYVSDIDAQCTGKKRYLTKAEAKSVKRTARAVDRACHAYRCPHCGLFHLGHLPRSLRGGSK